MEIANLASTALPSSSPAMPAEPKPDASFAQVLQSTKAPPGPEPPPDKAASGEKEQKTAEPNAQSKTPDLSSKDSQDNAAPAAVSKSPLLPVAPWLANFFGPQVFAAKGLPISRKLATASAPNTLAPVTGREAKNEVSLSALPQDPETQIVSAKSDSGAGVTLAAPVPTTQTPSQSLMQSETAVRHQPVPSAPDSSALAAKDFQSISDPDSPAPATQDSANTAIRDVALASTPVSDKAQPSHAPLTQTSSEVQSAAQLGSAGGSAGHTGGGNSQPDQQTKQGNPDPVSTIEAVKTIASHVDKLAVAKAVENVTVHLQSDENTSVVLTVKATHGQVQAQIVTDNGGLRSTLHQNRSELASNLQSKGMALGDVSVGLKNSSHERQQTAQAVRQLAAAAHVSSTTASANHRFRKATGVDLSV